MRELSAARLTEGEIHRTPVRGPLAASMGTLFQPSLVMALATWTPLAEAWLREWVMPLPSPMM